jgi:hypothetical protein
MTLRSIRDDDACGEASGGLSGFLRNLLAGIPWSDRAEAEECCQLEVPPSRDVKIRNANGRTHVVGEERSDIEVRAAKCARAESSEAAERLLREIRVKAGLVNQVLELEVEIPRRWNRHGSAHLEVRLPRDLRVSVSAANGKVCLEGMRRAVRARSSNGSVHISDVVGDIEVHTSNAKVSCDCTCGHLLARSSNGKIELDDHRGSIDASTANGPIRASLDELGREGVVLATSNGRIMLELPEEVNAELDMRVDNGLIRNHRELSAQTRDSNGRVRGRLGRGGSVIKLRTSNGIISLR